MLTHQNLEITNECQFYINIPFNVKKTWTKAGSLISPSISKVQWAAVRMWRLVMMEPPQKGVISPGDTRPTYVGCWIHIHTVLCLTCHGYSFTSVSTPPTILVRLLARPQLQVLLLLLKVVAAVDVVLIKGYICLRSRPGSPNVVR